MPHIRFNWVDILFVTLLVRIGYISFKNGLLSEFFRLLGLLSAYIVSFNSYTLVSQFLSRHAKWSGIEVDAISFLAVFFLIIFIFKILAVVSRMLLGRENISLASRIAALLLGLGRAVISISLIYTLFINSPFEYLSKSAGERSFSSRFISGVAPLVYEAAVKFYPWESIETPLVERLKKSR